MLNQSILLETDLWEVWIEYDEFDPQHFGMIYVIGEITVDHSATPPYILKGFSPNPGELVLRVPSPSTTRTKRKEVLYSEPIVGIGQYSSVSVYANNNLLACFNEIEVLI